MSNSMNVTELWADRTAKNNAWPVCNLFDRLSSKEYQQFYTRSTQGVK